jgi:hypothetical protein
MLILFYVEQDCHLATTIAKSLDENLIRNELTALEHAEQLAKRKGFYEAKYPQTKAGGAPGKAGGGKVAKSADSASFVKDTAAKTNQSPRTM